MGQFQKDFSTVEAFLNDDSFRVWVFQRRPEDQLYWQHWLVQHPEKRDLYEQAVATLLVLEGKKESFSDQEVSERVGQLVGGSSTTFTLKRTRSSWYWSRWVAVAAVACLVIRWQLDNPNLNYSGKLAPKKGNLAAPISWKIVKNETGQPMVVLLPDKSSVLLSTGSQLKFQKGKNLVLREVFLQGEAFFEVTKNPAKPFIVYTPNLTTKVLGTSFQVRSYGSEPTAQVKVKTGQVTVSSVQRPEKTYLLTVDEELNIEPSTRKISKHTHFLDKEKASAIIAQQFTFSHTPVPDILDKLEANYHMPIRYDQALLEQCTFTGELNDMPFLEKIRLICLTTESSFITSDNQIIITSKGCN